MRNGQRVCTRSGGLKKKDPDAKDMQEFVDEIVLLVMLHVHGRSSHWQARQDLSVSATQTRRSSRKHRDSSSAKSTTNTIIFQ